MYFGQPFRQFGPAPAGGLGPTRAPLTRGVAARTFSPVARGPMPARPTAPMPQVAPATQMPNAWQAELQRRAALQQQRQAEYQRQQAVAATARAHAVIAARAAAAQAQAQAQAAQQAAQAVSPIVVATPPTPAAMPGVSPGSPEADLRPTQDAADGGEMQPTPPSKKKFLFIGLAVVAVAGVGFVVLRKKKPKA